MFDLGENSHSTPEKTNVAGNKSHYRRLHRGHLQALHRVTKKGITRSAMRTSPHFQQIVTR